MQTHMTRLPYVLRQSTPGTQVHLLARLLFMTWRLEWNVKKETEKRGEIKHENAASLASAYLTCSKNVIATPYVYYVFHAIMSTILLI